METNHSPRNYRELLDNVSGVIYTTDIRGSIEFASAGVYALTGYTPEELIGRHFSFLVAPEYLAAVYDHYNDQLKTSTRETQLEFRCVSRQGEKKWVEQTALLLERADESYGFQCFVRDISEKKRIQQQLRGVETRLNEQQLFLQSILDNTTSLFYVKDRQGRYLMVNRRFLEVLQLTEEQVIGHTAADISSPEQAKRFDALDQELLATGKPIQVEEKLTIPSADIHILLTKFPLRDKNNNIYGISGIATDITERVQNSEQLIVAKTEAEDARKMQEQFLANMSHEIRTPMNGIVGMTNLLLETKLTPQQQQFAGVIRRSADNLLVIIDDILDLSKIKAGKLTIERIYFHLKDVTANIWALFEARILKKGLTFEISVDPRLPALLAGDPHRLNQVLINLVGNAAKFTQQGSIKVDIKLEKQEDKTAHLLFSVSDTGIGITPEQLPYIFDSFSQAGTDITRKYGGTGLGLTICQQLLAMQGGSIEVISEPGKGTIFSFRIAYGCDTTAIIGAQPQKSQPQNQHQFAGKHFLVVEDNPINQQLIEYVIKKAGADVTLAGHGGEAIEILKKQTFDLIIMDLQMPVMDGYETTKHLRTTMKLRTPILAMTANALKGEQVRCLEVGMDGYMSKPFEFRDFYSRVTALLEKAPDPQPQPVETLFNLSLLEEIGDRDYVRDTLTTFLDALPGHLKDLQNAFCNKNYDRLAFLAHKLRGTMGVFQARTLAEMLDKIEQSARERTDPGGLVPMTLNLLRLLARELKQYDRCSSI